MPNPFPARAGENSDHGRKDAHSAIKLRDGVDQLALDLIERLRVLIQFFVEQHNTKMPHPAFSGQTPDEMYFGTAVDLPTELAAARRNARAERLAANRAMTCNQCSGQQASPPVVPNSP